MKSPEEFKAFYDRELLPTLQQLDRDRKQLIFGSFKWIGLGLIPFVLSLIISAGQGSIFMLFAGLGIAAVIYYIKNYKKVGEIKSRFKQEVIAKMIQSIGPSLSYSPTGMISSSDYHKSKLYLDSINRYKGDDLVTGMIDKTAIRFSELLTQMETKRTNNGKTETQVTTVFRGLFFVADFNKHFVGETVVLPDTAESLFGSLGTMLQKWNAMRPQLIKLEDVEFEKAFAVYGTDQVEARYILSPALMQRILQFKQKSKSKIALSFIGSEVFVAVPLNDNLFEAPFFSSMVNFGMIEKFNRYLVLFIGIVEDLNLNNRIWTKE